MHQTSKVKISISFLVTASLLASCNTAIVPYGGGLSLAKTSIQNLDKNAVFPGDLLQIRGKNFDFKNQDDYQVVINFSDGTRSQAVIQSMNKDHIAIYVPYVYTQSQDLSAQVEVLNQNKPTTGNLSFTLKVPEFDPTQLKLAETLRIHLMQRDSVELMAQSIEKYIRQIQSEQSDSKVANQLIDKALVLSGQTFSEQSKLLDAILLVPDSVFNQGASGTPSTTPNSMGVQSNSVFQTQNTNHFKTQAEEYRCQKEEMITENDGLVVFYVNGMMTALGSEETKGSGYCYTQKLLKDRVKQLGIPAKVTGMYQYSLLNDVEKIESSCSTNYKQMEKEKEGKPWYEWFWKSLEQGSYGTVCQGFIIGGKITAGLGDLLESTFTRSDTSGSFWGWAPDAAQEAELTQKLEKLISENKRIIIMAHSQGNLYVTTVLRKMLSKAKNNGRNSHVTINLPGANREQTFIGPVTGPGSTLGELMIQQVNSGAPTREQILNSIGFIGIASPVRIEDRNRLTPSEYCSSDNFSPTCHSYYIGVRQDPVAQLRWADARFAAGGLIMLGSGLIVSGTASAAGAVATGSVPAVAFLSDVRKAITSSILDVASFDVHPNRDYDFDNGRFSYNQTMFYSPYEPGEVFAEKEMKKSSSQKEKLDFSFDHHSMDSVYLGYGHDPSFLDRITQNALAQLPNSQATSAQSDEAKPDHPLFLSSGSTVTPWQKIKQALKELSEQLVETHRGDVELTIE